MNYPNPYLLCLTVVCTHDGQYPDEKIWRFGETMPGPNGRYGWPEERTHTGERRHVPRHEGRIRQAGGPGRLFCGICRRNPRPSLAGWHQICEEWRRDVGDTLDISKARR